MEISPEQLESFRALYLKKFGIELTQQETLEKALALLTLMKAVYQPMTAEDQKAMEQRRSQLTQSN